MEIRTRLVNYMKELGDKDLCVAFSGGVDSSVILRAACEAATANGIGSAVLLISISFAA